MKNKFLTLMQGIGLFMVLTAVNVICFKYYYSVPEILFIMLGCSIFFFYGWLNDVHDKVRD